MATTIPQITFDCSSTITSCAALQSKIANPINAVTAAITANAESAETSATTATDAALSASTSETNAATSESNAENSALRAESAANSIVITSGNAYRIEVKATSDNQVNFTLPVSGMAIMDLKSSTGQPFLSSHFNVVGTTLTISGYSFTADEYLLGWGVAP